MTNQLLVLDDEALIAWGLADEMEDLGWTALVVGTVADALRAIEAGRVDAAVLDFNLRGETSEPVAETMISKALPFVFVTGALSEAFPGFGQPVHVLSKPVDVRKLNRVLQGLLPGQDAALRPAASQLHA